MTTAEFAQHIVSLAAAVPFSVTSYGRSRSRNAAVGGGPASYHLQFLAVDIVLDKPADRALLGQMCKRVGLEMINEGDHLHIEPK